MLSEETERGRSTSGRDGKGSGNFWRMGRKFSPRINVVAAVLSITIHFNMDHQNAFNP